LIVVELRKGVPVGSGKELSRRRTKKTNHLSKAILLRESAVSRNTAAQQVVIAEQFPKLSNIYK
jgi:hypothetical protein